MQDDDVRSGTACHPAQCGGSTADAVGWGSSFGMGTQGGYVRARLPRLHINMGDTEVEAW